MIFRLGAGNGGATSTLGGAVGLQAVSVPARRLGGGGEGGEGRDVSPRRRLQMAMQKRLHQKAFVSCSIAGTHVHVRADEGARSLATMQT